METCVQALLEAGDNTPQERVKPCDVQNEINSLKLKKACGIDGVHVPKGHRFT
jgi:hypothetical protein